MAQSPSHKLGQIIGDELESSVHSILREVAEEFGLYLDHKHPRPCRRGRKKVAWKDSNGNTHDLDYVLEKGGSEYLQGQPVAFIETAWRRYTKHSRNKAQEIQGAIIPLAETFKHNRPFLGAVLGGVFTEGSIIQLHSLEFDVAYCPYDTIVESFACAGVDISFDEVSSNVELQRKVDAFERLSYDQRQLIANEIRKLNEDQFTPFIKALRRCISRRVQIIYVLTLSGTNHEFVDITDAVHFVSGHDHRVDVAGEFVRYELNVRYSNGDEIKGCFQTKNGAIDFLENL